MAEESEDDDNTHFLKKPLFYWMKPFAEQVFAKEENFSKFVASDVLEQALQSLGITTVTSCSSSTPVGSQPPSLSSFSLLDEDLENGGSSLTSTSSRSKQDLESRDRIRKLSGVIGQVRSHYDQHLNLLLLSQLPNVVHISTACDNCGIVEMEKILRLLLGIAVQGTQKQETMRKIREFPSQIQHQLIEAIKEVTDSPDLLQLHEWRDFESLNVEEQQKFYDMLMRQFRQLLNERNALLEWRRLTEFASGVTNCEERRESNAFESLSLDLEKCGEFRSSMTRQLREELFEKSDLLKECRDELEMTKSKLQDMHKEMIELRTQLKIFKTNRDEFDILREGQEKAVRMEAELVRMRKKLEDSEQYYEQAQILENENRAYQRKHAILTDRINVLTVENERLELSFLTHQSHRSPYPHLQSSFMTDPIPSTSAYTPNLNSFTDELLLDSEEETPGQSEVRTLTPTNQGPTPVPGQMLPRKLDLDVLVPKTGPGPTPVRGHVSPRKLDLEVCPTPVRGHLSPKKLNLEVLAPEVPKAPEQSRASEIILKVEPMTPEKTGALIPKVEATTPDIWKTSEAPPNEDFDTPSRSRSHREGRERRSGGPKRSHRRIGSIHGKRTKKSNLLFPPTKVTLQKVHNLRSFQSREELQEPSQAQPQVVTKSQKVAQRKLDKRKGHEGVIRSSGRNYHDLRDVDLDLVERQSQYTPHYSSESDADEELSQSPNPLLSDDRDSDRDSELELMQARIIKEGGHEDEVIVEDGEDEDELFFVCSTIQPPPMARNVRIYAPSRDPHHSAYFSATEGLESFQRQEKPSAEFRNLEQNLDPSRYSFNIQLRHINKQEVSLGLTPPTTHQPPIKDRHQTAFTNGRYSGSQLRDTGSTTEEDDDNSIWYEYGCV